MFNKIPSAAVAFRQIETGAPSGERRTRAGHGGGVSLPDWTQTRWDECETSFPFHLTQRGQAVWRG